MPRFDSSTKDYIVNLLDIRVHLCRVKGLSEVLVLVLLLLAGTTTRRAHGLPRRITSGLIEVKLPLPFIDEVLGVRAVARLLLTRHPNLE